jgi:hypothetical protein
MRDQVFAGTRPYSREPIQTEFLPFRIRLAVDSEDLAHAVALRSDAYGRHVPALKEAFCVPEEEDHHADAILLLAESKLDGSVLGSLRLLTNTFRPLGIEREVTLPARFQGSRLLEARRLTVRNGSQGRMVTTALSKALYEICHALEIDYVLITARRPVDLMYRAMQFDNALGEGKSIRLSDVSNLPHGLYYLPIQDADRLWRNAQCPMYSFMALTEHPDIQIDYEEIHRKFERQDLVEQERFHNSPCP